MATRHLRYDAVLFDVGGTLIGFFDWRPFQEFLEELGRPATEADSRQLHRRFVDTLLARRDEAQGLGSTPAELDYWWRGLFRVLWPAEPSLAEAMFDAFRADRFDRVFPDVRPTLDALAVLGVPMGVVSNFSASLENLLRHLGLRGFFGFVITSAQVGIAKPDRGIFDLAVAQTGRPPWRLLYVGDHFGDDIQGARGAGLDAALIDREDRQVQAPCSRLRTLLDLVPYLDYPMAPATTILLDLDGVVVDSLAAHLIAWQQTLAPLGIQVTREDLALLEGMPTRPMARKLAEQFLGRPCSEDEAARLAETKKALFVRHLHPQPIPGIVPLLHNLRGRGYRLALVTGSAASAVAALLPKLGVDALFEQIVTADDVAQGKPDAEPYRVAAQRLGASPSECLVIENAPPGIQSAKAAGMRCVAVETTLSANRLAGADKVFPDVQTLAAWILTGGSPLQPSHD